MRLYRNLEALKCLDSQRRVVTVGAYDGVHLGHQEIVRQLKARANEYGCLSLVLCFEPIPREFFAPTNPPSRLTCFRERFELLGGLGIDEMFCARFSELQDLTPESFIRHLLVEALNVSHVVIGHDFRFAYNRLGTPDDLSSAGKQYGFGVTTVPAVYWEGHRVSSTSIRETLRAGVMEQARGMLGREYSISGRVVRGLGLGRKLGFPTANVNLNRRQTPVDGIFAARVTGADKNALDAVASVGVRPTVGGDKPLLEVFIFDFDRDIYGDYITVQFVRRLREERMFSSLDAMKRQMQKDAIEARETLAA